MDEAIETGKARQRHTVYYPYVFLLEVNEAQLNSLVEQRHAKV